MTKPSRILPQALALLLGCAALGACDHTSNAMVYGRVRLAGNVAAPANALVVVTSDQYYRYYTVTNVFGEYSCPIREFVGPLGDRPVTVRAFDGKTAGTMVWDKGDMLATRINVTVRDTAADLRTSLGDSIGTQYRRCEEF